MSAYPAPWAEIPLSELLGDPDDPASSYNAFKAVTDSWIPAWAKKAVEVGA